MTVRTPLVYEAGLAGTAPDENIFNYSEEFNNWSATTVTVTANNMVGPLASNPNQVADKIEAGGSGANQSVSQTVQVPGGIAGKTITTSVYVYAESAFDFTIRTRGTGTTQEALNTTVTTLTDGWVRVSQTKKYSASADGDELVVFIYTAVFGTNNSNVYWLFGAQMNVGPLRNYVATPKNLVLRSEDITTAWTLFNATATANAALDPFGQSVTADLFTRNRTAAVYMYQGVTRPTAVTTFTFSAYAKKSVGNFFALRVQSPYPSRADATFNIDTGVVSSITATNFTNQSAAIIDVGNGWFRCSLTFTTIDDGSTASATVLLSFNSNGTTIDGADSAANSAGFVWGIQIEDGSAATSYVQKIGTHAVNLIPATRHSTDTSGFLRPVTPAELLEWQTAIIDVYAADPSSVLSVVSGSGTISPTMADTRLQAGAAQQGSDGFVAAFPNASQTGDVSTVTVNYDKVSGSFVTSNTGEVDSGFNFPLYFNEDTGSIQPMNLEDLVDSIIEPTIDLMVAATESDTTAGTYTISTSTSVTDYTEVSGANTAIYADTRANTSAYTAAGIPETQDQPTTINSYYLHRRNAGSTTPSTQLLHLDNAYADPTQQANVKDFDIRQYTIAEATTLLGTWLKVYAGEVSGYKITYSITTDGSGGNARGSSMVDTKLDGSGAFSTTLQDTNDYRAQEFPNGSAATVTTYTLRVTKA